MYYASPGEMPAALLGRTRSSQALLDSPTVFLYRSPSEPKAVAFSITADAVEQMNRAWLAENGGHGDREVGGWLLADKRVTDRIIGATDSTVEAADGALTMEIGTPSRLRSANTCSSRARGTRTLPAATVSPRRPTWAGRTPTCCTCSTSVTATALSI